MKKYDLIIKGGELVNEGKRFFSSLAIKDGRIAKIAEEIDDNEAFEVFDASGKTIIPGAIDTQVHFREPGLTHKEDIESGSRSALLGGVTTFFEMPNTNPATTTVESIREKVEIAKAKSYTNFAFYMGATAENLHDLRQAHEVEGCCGIKIFLGSSTGDLLLHDEEPLREIFRHTQGVIAVHSEDEAILNRRREIQQKATSAHAHPEWRNPESAMSSTERIVQMAREETKEVRLHVLHISTAEEMEFLKNQKDVCTVEVTPQHLTLVAPECYDELGTYAQMNPPIREARHREALWKGLENGTVDVIGSDHAPHTKEEKEKGYPKSPSGMPGVQTILPIMLDHVLNGKLKLEKLVEMMCHWPAKRYNLEKLGYIKTGYRADLTFLKLNESFEIRHEQMASKCGWTPYHGKKLMGEVKSAMIAGEFVMRDQQILRRGKVIPVR